MGDLTVIAVDWSGAKGDKRHSGIWVTAHTRGERVLSRGSWRRGDVVDYVASLAPPVVVGFDFSFGLPRWFAQELGCATIAEVWARSAADGERWLEPTEPFWDKKRPASLRPEMRLRRCEERVAHDHRITPASVFALVGAKMVGKGSVRGMPHLATLRTREFAIWPFDVPADRVCVEIYPALLRTFASSTYPKGHQGDAEASAEAMWQHRNSFAALPRVTDPVTLLEGEIWHP